MSTEAERGILYGLGVMFAGLSLFGAQCLWFLRDGAWTPLSIVDALEMLPLDPSYNDIENFRSWLESPQSWIALHMCLDWLSLPGVLLVFGLLTVSGSKG